jgi:CBS-domain-containing membrane protein
MTMFTANRVSPPLVLNQGTAAELMSRRPLAFMHDTPIPQAAALLRLHELRAAPVIDFAGRPLGLVTVSACQAWEEFSRRSAAGTRTQTGSDWTPVSQIASPNIDLVRIDTPIRAVIDAFVERRTWRLFVTEGSVTEGSGELVGTIRMADVLRHLAPHCLAGECRRRVRRAGASSLC